MNKICTSIEQSKELIELGIGVNTADMCYCPIMNIDSGNNEGYLEIPECYSFSEVKDSLVPYLPAWSLTALFDALPEGVIENYNAPNLQKENGKYSIAYGNEELLCVADNPLDACYEMILKLHEEKLL